MYFLFVVLIKETRPSFQSIFLVLSLIMKIVKYIEARLVINFGLCKETEEKNAEQNTWNE